MPKLIVLFLYLALILSCNRPVNSVKVTMENINEEVKVNGSFEEIKYLSEILSIENVIPLQFTDSSVIGKVNKVLQVDNNQGWLILDKNSAKKLFHFSGNGEFIGRIGSHGSGPQEYSELTEFCYHNNCIFILDQQSKKVLVFDIDHSFKNSFTIPFVAIDFCVLNNNEILFYSNGSHEIIITDGHGKIIKKEIKKDLRWRGLQNDPICETANYATFRNQFSNTIYSWDIENNSSNEILINLQLPKPIVKLDQFLEFEKRDGPMGLPYYPVSSDYVAEVFHILQSKDYFYFVFIIETMPFYCVYNRNSESYKIFNSEVNDDLFFQKFGLNVRGIGYDNMLLGIVYPDKIIHLEQFNKKFQLNIHENSNPIIAITSVNK